MRPRRLVALAFALPLATVGPAAAVAATLQPKLPDLTGIVKDPKWAVVLGKALFWDVSVGSDGMACASCHFHAGADVRMKNALSPGLIELPDPTLGSAQRSPYRRSRSTRPRRAAPWTRRTRWTRTTSRFTSSLTSSIGTRRSTSRPMTWSRLRGGRRHVQPHPADRPVRQVRRGQRRRVPRRRVRRAAGRAAQHPDHDQRGVQSPQLLGRAGDERLQRGRGVRPGRRAERPGQATGRPAERQSAAHLPQPA